MAMPEGKPKPSLAAEPEPPLRQLWEQWRQQQRPDFARFTAAGHCLSSDQALALLRFDQHERWRSGDRIPVEAYLPSYRLFQEDADAVVVFIYSEFLLRQELGETPALEEYLQRFPQHAEGLREQYAFGCDVQAASLPTVIAASPASHQPVTRIADSPDRGQAAAPWPTVAGYEILGHLGRGGMGIVYQAWQQKLNRVVALKMVLADALPEELARFRIEVEAVARLQHPNIVQIYEVGEQDGRPFFAMEYADGGQLAQQLGGTPLPVRRAAELAEVLARAIHYAHQQGIVHRDLKPANVLLLTDGTPKITDFGLAKIVIGGGVTQTQTGAILGTPSYMPPEQAAGRTREVGPATDVYALGAMLYEMLTGRPPFRAATPLETVQQVVSNEPVTPRNLQPKIPRDLQTICLKCLEKDPRRRYTSAQALAEDLRRFLNHEPIQARPLRLPARIHRWCRRNPGPALAAAALWIALCVSMVFAILQYQAVMDHRKALAERNFELGLELCEKDEMGQGLLWMARGLELLPAGATDFERVIRINLASWSSRLHALQAILRQPEPIVAGVFSPDGKTVVTAGKDQTIQFWETATGKPQGVPLRHPGPIASLAICADGHILVLGCDKKLRIWETATESFRSLPPVDPDPLTLPSPPAAGGEGRVRGSDRALILSPDGRFLLTLPTNDSAQLLEPQTGRPLGQLLKPTGPVQAAALSSNGQMIVTASGDKVQVWSVVDGKPVLGPLDTLGPVTAVAVSADGKRVLAGTKQWKVWLWDVGSGKPTKTHFQHQSPVATVALHPDGQTIASGSHDGKVRLRDGERERLVGQPLLHPGPVSEVVFSPDGKILLTRSGDGVIRLWRVASEEVQRVPLRYTSYVNDLAFSPDGRTALTGSDDKTARFWDVETGSSVGKPLVHGEEVHAVAFGGDGEWVVTGCDDETAQLWQVATGERQVSFEHSAPVRCVAVSRDGRTLLTGCTDGMVRLWDPASGRLLRHFHHGGPLGTASISRDGRVVLTGGGDGTVRLWDAATGKALTGTQSMETRIRHWSRVFVSTFHPDGSQAATGSADTTARLWRVPGGEAVGAPLWHQSQLGAVAFSPDGSLLLSGCFDHTARLWDTALKKPLGPPLLHDGPVIAVSFSPDGRRLLTGSAQENAIRRWPVPLPVAGDAKSLQLWLQSATGMEMDDSGGVRILDAHAWQEHRQRLEN